MRRITPLRALSAALLAGATACSNPSTESGRSGTVRVCWPRDPESLNPVALPNAYAVQINNLLYQSLLAVDAPKRRYVPWLATALPTVQRRDSLTYLHYRLRPEATWDNGQPIRARDVLFSLKVLTCPGLPNEGQRGALSFVLDARPDAADPNGFTLTCRGYAPDFLTTSGDFPVLPEYLLDPDTLLRQVPVRRFATGDTTLARHAAVQTFVRRFNEPARWRDPRVVRGSGPYELSTWQVGQRLTLTRKARWWADALRPAAPPLVAHPTRLEFHIVPNSATALLALRRGELDVYPRMAGPDFARLQRESATAFRFYSPASYRVVVLETNTQQTQLRDARTRRALGHLLNAEQLMRATQYGQGQRTIGLVNPQEKWAYHDSLPLIAFSPPQAVDLLQQAGWRRTASGWHRPGQDAALTLNLHYAAGERTFETIALAFQRAAQQIGLPVTLRPTEAGLLAQLRRDGGFDLCLRTLYGSPFSYDLRPLLHTRSIGAGGANRTRFGDAASDRLLDAIVATEDSVGKARLLHKLQVLLYRESPLVPLFFEPNRLAVARRLTGVRVSGLEPGLDLPALIPASAAKR